MLQSFSLFGDRTGTNAAGTDFNLAFLSVDHRIDALQIGLPDFFGFVVRVTYIVADKRFFTADFTNFGHHPTP
jgi:hypothetical protein